MADQSHAAERQPSPSATPASPVTDWTDEVDDGTCRRLAAILWGAP